MINQPLEARLRRMLLLIRSAEIEGNINIMTAKVDIIVCSIF